MLYLASKSPRRSELLNELNLPFEVLHAPVHEKAIEALWQEEGRTGGVKELVMRLATAKARAVQKLLQKDGRDEKAIILAADTLVVLEERILHKPQNKEDARACLLKLAGQTHTVLTGCALLSALRSEVFVSATEVTFYPLDPFMEDEIERYINTPGPYDKAGAYGIQEGGKFLIKKIEGDYFTVVGLPLAEVKRRLLPLIQDSK